MINVAPPRIAPIPYRRGKKIRLSLARRFVCDLLAFAKRVPSVPMERKMRLADVVEARAAWPKHISWCAIFIKAYAQVAREYPELRRAYIPLPWAHLYEHPSNVASFSLEREFQGEDAVFFSQVADPETMTLQELDRLVRYCKIAPLHAIPSYRRALWLSRLPLPLRRLAWAIGLNWNGRYRSYFFGTFGVSVVASIGAAGLHILSPLTTTLNYGVLEPDGSLEVRLAYDHRVMDGATAARALVHLEQVLHERIVPELLAGIRYKRHTRDIAGVEKQQALAFMN